MKQLTLDFSSPFTSSSARTQPSKTTMSGYALRSLLSCSCLRCLFRPLLCRAAHLLYIDPRSCSRFHRIRNIGNTCYISAILQALTALKTFESDLTRPALSALLTRGDSLLDALVYVYASKHANRELHGNSASPSAGRVKPRPIDPSRLRDVIARNAARFRGNAQQVRDGMVCFSFMLTGVSGCT